MASVLFFDEYGNQIETSQRHNHSGSGGFGNVENGLNGKSPSEQQETKNNHKRFSLGTNKINQTDHLAQKFLQKAQPIADALHKVSPTRANFRYGQPSSWNLDNLSSVTFTADKPHGIPVGHCESFKNGEVESINNTQVKVSRIKI